MSSTRSMPSRSKVWHSVAAPLTALGVALAVTSVALLAGQHNPLVAYQKMLKYGWSLDSLVVAINQSLPLIMSALAVTIGFKMNLFNIGVEGQYRLAALVAAAAGANIAGPGFFKIIVTVVVAVVVGAAYAAIAGVLKATRNVNEVVGTIMLNGIAFSIIGFLLHRKWIASIRGSFLSTTKYSESAWFPSLHLRDKVTELYLWVVPVVLLTIAFHYLVTRSRFGYDLRATGMNPDAARTSGVDPKKMIVVTMLISGGLAGLVGMSFLLNQYHTYTQNFPEQFGFGGIAVALVGRQKAVGIVITAFLFAMIARMSQVLPDPPLFAPREIGPIIQGTMMLSAVVAYEVVQRRAQAAAIREAAEATHAAQIAKNLDGAVA
jgi:general nucleoside transport system permease protein